MITTENDNGCVLIAHDTLPICELADSIGYSRKTLAVGIPKEYAPELLRAVNEHACLCRVASAAQAVRAIEDASEADGEPSGATIHRHGYLAAVNELDYALAALQSLRSPATTTGKETL